MPNGDRSPFWAVDFTWQGKRIVQSTGTMDKPAALRIGQAKLAAVMSGHWGKLAATRLKKRADSNEAPSMSELELHRRFIELMQKLLAGDRSTDKEILYALEQSVSLPPALRPYRDTLMVIRQVRESGIYILTKGDEVTYVGQSTRVLRRLYAHEASKIEFDAFYFLPCAEGDLNQTERKIIAAFPHCKNRNQGMSCEASPYVARRKAALDDEPQDL